MKVRAESDVLKARGLPAHLYAHVPFCRSKCAYCDFYSLSDPDPEFVTAVFAGIRAELTAWQRSSLEGVLDSVYVGGGTPTHVAAHTARLLADVRERFVLHPLAEVTVEANPESVNPASIEALAGAGTTRLSVGVQSFDEGILRLLGRAHGGRRAAHACTLVKDADLELAVDLICGVPGQSVTSWAETLDGAIRSGADHVSVYPLSIEEGTPLSVAVTGGLVAPPDPDAAADMMLLAEEVLGRSGLQRYETSNYARAGHESRHNTAYWTGRPYIGVGPAAHGMLTPETARAIGVAVPEDTARVRYGNAPDLEDWLSGRAEILEWLSAEEAAREDVMLGLRLTSGVDDDIVETAGVHNVMHALQRQGLVEEAEGRWRTTSRGWLLGNEVFERVWAGV